MTRFDYLVLNKISMYSGYWDLGAIIFLVPRELRKDIDEIFVFMPEYYYCRALKRGLPIPEKEDIISQDPEYSFWYVLKVIKKRWPIKNGRKEKEDMIARNPKWSYMYTEHVIRDRWPIEDNRKEKEDMIARNPEWSYIY